MSFKVYRNESDPFEQFGDDDRFDIIEGGVLRSIGRTGRLPTSTPRRGPASTTRRRRRCTDHRRTPAPATSPRKSSPSNHHARTDAVPAGGGPSSFSWAGSARRVQSLNGGQDNDHGPQHALAAR